MPQHKSPKKRMRQDKKRALRNKAARSELRSAVKKLRQAGSSEEATKALSRCTSLLDKAAKKSVFHKKTAGRTKSRLAKAARKVS
ncbi:MAG: 30S ribosomal protein S20 [Candidatus Eiseniibacteriota bacterium]|nr:MAG: 30S ribosomal protein S20 [Candidatus Eisenbacteria bacterium]